MKIKYASNEIRKTTIADIKQGDLYRFSDNEYLYMKIKTNSSINSVSLTTGFTFNHGETRKVIPVDGTLVENYKEY